MRKHVLREDADDALLRFLACMAPGTKEAGPPLRKAMTLDEMRVRIRPDRSLEDVRLDDAWNDVNGDGDATLAPVRAQPLAQNDETVALVVDPREELFVRAPEGQEPRLDDLAPREPLGEENLICSRKMRGVHAKQRDPFHCSEPDPELEQQRGRLGKADVEIPPARI